MDGVLNLAPIGARWDCCSLSYCGGTTVNLPTGVAVVSAIAMPGVYAQFTLLLTAPTDDKETGED